LPRARSATAATRSARRTSGTLVVVHVANVPAFGAQQRYIPIYDQDLNRALPGRSGSNTAGRMANELREAFLSNCDYGLDLHTSTRNRTTMFHLRAETSNPEVERLARAFGANVVLAGPGAEGSLRRAATAAGTPTVTVEMGKAHRFQPVLIEKALEGVEGVLENPVALPGHPLCHLVRIGEGTAEEIEREISTGEFDGYRANGTVWRAGEEQE
jgi:predicted deacylase